MTGSPWRILILDRDPEDPKWLFATVSIPSDVRPAVLDASGHYQDWPEITAWVRTMFPGAVELTLVHGVLAWTAAEPRPQ
jgi:hypothetical protein